MKKVGGWIRNCVELYIPIAALLIMFCTFVFQIFSRYVLKQPVQWAYEVTVMCYLWMVVLGALFTERDRSHVTFTLFYDQFGVKGKALIAFLGNALMLVAFVAMFIPSCNMILDQMSKQVTSVFKIGLNIVYFPFIPFNIIMVIYFLMDIVNEVMVFTGLGGQAAIDKMLNATKNETEEAIAAALAEENAKEGK